MNLVSIERPAEEFAVASALPKISGRTLAGWWTSGLDDIKNRWTWTATGRGITYKNWGSEFSGYNSDQELLVSKKAVAMMVSDFHASPYWANSLVTDKHYPLCEN
jgi:hypothetical protein